MGKRGPKPWQPSAADIEYVQECAAQGIAETKIAEGLEKDYGTYRRNIHIFAEALKKGRAEFDLSLDRAVPQVVNSMLKRCLGYEYEEVQTKQEGRVVNGKMHDGDVTITKTKKHIQASDAAIFFFLCNRDKLKWINPMKLDEAKGDHSGEIMSWIKQLKNEPAK
jgi:hypothetical protein